MFASINRIYPKYVTEEITEVEQVLSDKIQKVLKMDLQPEGQKNDLEKNGLLDLQK